MKKIIVLILSFTAVFCSMTVCAETENTDIHSLIELGILDSSSKVYFEENDYITVGEFLVYIENIMHENLYTIYDTRDALQYAYNNGLLSRERKVQHHNNLKAELAYEIAVNALGYKRIAELYGAYPENYRLIAGATEINKGITAGGEKFITKGEVVRLIHNIIEAEPIDISLDQPYDGIDYSKGILERYRKIKIVEGILDAVPSTGLYTPFEVIREGKISIGKVEYDNGGFDCRDMLGARVKAYVKHNKSTGTDEIIYIGLHKKTTELIIEDEDIKEYDMSLRRLSYYSDETKIKKVELSPSAAVIINGSAYPDYEEVDLCPRKGRLRLIDNDSDDVYDAVIVTSYETVVVDYVSQYNKKIKNKYTYTGATQYIPTDEDEYMIDVEKNGVKIGIAEINQGDVLTVARSRNGKIITILVSDNITEGQITRISNEEEKVTVNDSEFVLSKAYFLDIASNEALTDELKPGLYAEVYTDVFGEVAYAKVSSDEKYGYAIKLSYDKNLEECWIKILDSNGEWTNYNTAKKVKINNNQKNKSEVTTVLANFSPQLIKYRTDSENKINLIETAKQSDKYLDGQFTVSSENSLVYQGNNKSFDTKWFVEDNNVIWFVPYDPADMYDQDAYYVDNAASLYSDRSYTFTAYDGDEYNFSGNYVVKMLEDELEFKKRKNGVFVVNKVLQAVTADSEVKNMLVGVMFKYDNISVSFADGVLPDGIATGDVLVFRTNQRGEIESFEKVCSAKNGYVSKLPDKAHTSVAYFQGKAIKKQLSDNRIMLDCGTAKQSLRIDASVPVIVCEKGRDGISATRGSINDIEYDDFLVVRAEYSKVTGIVIYK